MRYSNIIYIEFIIELKFCPILNNSAIVFVKIEDTVINMKCQILEDFFYMDILYIQWKCYAYRLYNRCISIDLNLLFLIYLKICRDFEKDSNYSV